MPARQRLHREGYAPTNKKEMPAHYFKQIRIGSDNTMNKESEQNLDYIFDAVAFKQWSHQDRGDNHDDLERTKKLIPIIFNEILSPVQRSYITRYYLMNKSMEEIARDFSVNRSTVSRTISRGIKKAYGYLRFSSPLFINAAPPKRANNRRARKRKLEV